MLGVTREEKMESLHRMVNGMMDRYATGFNKDDVRNHQDLLYYYTVHEYRENDDGTVRPGIHVHIIVSREDNTGKYKLSPMTNHRRESSGVIKSGFNRDSFYRDCERIFDTSFGYQRPISGWYSIELSHRIRFGDLIFREQFLDLQSQILGIIAFDCLGK